MKKIVFLCLLAVPLLLGLKETNVSPVAGASTIKIGVAAPFSGRSGSVDFTARSIIHSATLAVDEWNAKGGVLGKKIELVVQDDQNNPEMAPLVAEEFIKNKVVGVIGHANSGVSLAAMKYYDQAGIPMISPTSTNVEVTKQGYRGVFRTCGKDSEQARVAAAFAIGLKVKKAVLIYDSTAYGQGLADEFMRQIKGKIEVVYYSRFDEDNRDFPAMLQEIALKKPDLIYFCGSYMASGSFLRQARELGIDAVFMGGDDAAEPEFINVAGQVKNVYFTSNPNIMKIASAKDFVTKYEKNFGPVNGYSAYAYDAANVLLTAIKEAGTTSGEEVINKLHSLTFDGVLGAIKFDKYGDVDKATYVIWTIKKGKLVEYTPELKNADTKNN